MPRGSKGKYKKELCEKARALLEQGYSKQATAGALGISVRTFYQWLEDHPQFSQAVEQGEAGSQKWWEDRGRESCAGDSFNATVWVMTMKNRFGWRDKQEITGEDGGALVVQIMKHGDKDQDSG